MKSRELLVPMFTPEEWKRDYWFSEVHDGTYTAVAAAAFECAKKGFMFPDELIAFWDEDLTEDNLYDASDDVFRQAIDMMLENKRAQSN